MRIHRSTRFLSIVLVLAMLVQMLPMQTFALSTSENAAASTESIDAHVVAEIPEKRTAFSKEFKMSNGLHMATVYPDAVHYEDNGQWKDIDNTLKASQVNGKSRYVNTAGIWDVSFPQQLSDDQSVSITKDGYTLSFFMAGELHTNSDAELMTEPEETLLEETAPEETATEETVPEETFPEEFTPEETVPAETSSEETIPEETVPKETAPEETVPLETLPEATSPTETIPEETVPTATTPDEAIPITPIPEETFSTVTIPENTVAAEDLTAETPSALTASVKTSSVTRKLSNDTTSESVPEDIISVKTEFEVTEAKDDLKNDSSRVNGDTNVSTPVIPFRLEEARSVRGEIQSVDISKMIADADHPETISDKLHSRLEYENVFSNTDIIYDLTSNQLKESIVINQYDDTLVGYQYTLNVGKLTPVLTQSGKIELYDESGKELIMVMPAPYLVDNAQVYSYDVSVDLTQNKSTYTLTYTLPKAWMADQNRQWPVILDPIVSATSSYTNIKDQNVYSKAWADPEAGVLQCGYNKSDGFGIMRFYLQYVNLPSLTSADIIVSAAVHLYKPADSGTKTSVEVHKVTETWDSMTMQWDNKADFDPIIEDYAISQKEGFYSWDVTDIVRGWYEGDNTGMMFKNPDSVEKAGTNSWKQFISSDYGSDNNFKPSLLIMFRNNNGLESYWDYTSSSAGRAGTGYINNYTGNLVWIRNDIGFGGNRMPVSISHVYNANDSQNNTFGLGYGWRTNYNQLVYKWSDSNAYGDYYVWEDSDGTKHYFKKESTGVYKDEDGLELTLTTTGSGTTKFCIADKYDNKSYFDTKGRLTKQENNQKTPSSITINYTTTSSKLISTITDGAGRTYSFTYTSSLLSKISYMGSNSTEHNFVSFGYTGSQLTTITDKDSETSTYTYTTNNLLSTVEDIDGYKLAYTYNIIKTGKPARVTSVTESDDGANGGTLSIEYAKNQTTFEDYSGNVQIMQFNNFGNTISVQDDQGRAQYSQYAINDPSDEETATASTTTNIAKGNQLILSSKLQNTVGNLLSDSSFENSTAWTATSTAVSSSISSDQAYYGNNSLKLTRSASGSAAGTYSPAFSVAAGNTVTFSAYVKTGTGSAYLALDGGGSTETSSTLNTNSDWTRLEVSYTNNGTSSTQVTARLLTEDAGTTYLDCVQVELAATASRYNLVENGDFRDTSAWSASTGRTTLAVVAAPELSNDVYTFTGSPTKTMGITQTVAVSGTAGDTYVLGGWAKGDSAPLEAYDTRTREFSVIATFNNTDDTTTTSTVRFSPYTDSSVNWQYAAAPIVAEKDYSSIEVKVAYDYNVNTVYFDGIQLYKEEFGNSYTYDEDGNVIAVKDLQGQMTEYEYTDNDLTKAVLPTGATLTYTYDDYHNVLTATTDTGIVYNFTYDDYGNNTMVSIEDNGVGIVSSATYSTDGNRLVTTTDAAGNVTTYSYNAQTNILEWVQYPKDTESTRTEYTYDTMYRLASAEVTTDTGYTLNASYTYADDLLTEIETASTTYAFCYGNFALRSSIKAGSRTLAAYSYTFRTNYLSSLDYGNNDSVDYTYDQQGRVTKQTYEDGDTVTYQYDNSGALATVTDSASGRTAAYYYDFTDRLMKYTESADGYDFSVGYAYDEINNLTALIETINGVDHTTAYTYDDDNRVTSVGNGDGSKTYTYDNFSRVSQRETKAGNTTVHTDTFTYRSPSADKTTGQVASLSVAAIGFNKTYSYSYDVNGNIESVSDGSNTTSYVYDSAGQLLRENNQAADKTWVWTYDDAGNILSRSEYSYTTGELGTPSDTVIYAYNDSGWGDLLTSYDDTTIYVDAIGNPVSDGTWSYDWHHGRQLEKLSGEGPTGHISVEYTYDANGLRTEKTVTTKAFEAVGTRTGLFLCSDGEIRYFENGTPSYAGLIQDENGNYYYINSSLTAVRNRSYWITNHNNLLIESPYTFAHDGRMVVDEAYAEGGTLFSGLRRDADGEIRYYMSGVPVYAGLIQYEDGNYYYITSSMVAVRNCSYYISTTNGLLPEGTYSFDENGVLIDPPAQTESAAASTFSSSVYRVLVPDQTTTYTYTYNGGSLVQMSAGNDILYFAYDTSGPMSVTWNDTTYFYVTNLQGDIVAILDANGTAVVTYTYDAWGRILTTGGTLANSLGSINPLRYRGYVYDTESGLYYLQSRFYAPKIGRFVNADGLFSADQDLLSYNAFSYCKNNPIANFDPEGTIAVATAILIGSAVVGAVTAAYTAYKEYQAGFDTFQIVGDSVCAGFAAFSIVYSGGMSLYQVYQNYCYLNAITPITSIGSSPAVSTTVVNPLEQITYTEKVQQQKMQHDFHAFPDIVDNYGSMGVQSSIIGGDGNIYTKLMISGAYKGREGNFVYIWDQDFLCNHRLFEIKR